MIPFMVHASHNQASNKTTFVIWPHHRYCWVQVYHIPVSNPRFYHSVLSHWWDSVVTHYWTCHRGLVYIPCQTIVYIYIIYVHTLSSNMCYNCSILNVFLANGDATVNECAVWVMRLWSVSLSLSMYGLFALSPASIERGHWNFSRQW